MATSLSYPGVAMPGSAAAVAAAAAYRQMQQQQSMVVSADQTHHHHHQLQHLPPVDPYVVAMDKVTQELANLEKEKGSEKFNAARKEVRGVLVSFLQLWMGRLMSEYFRASDSNFGVGKKLIGLHEV